MSKKEPSEKDSLLKAGAGETSSYNQSKGNDGSEQEQEDNGSALITSFILMLIFQLANRVLGRLCTYPMHNYPMFMNILGVGLYVPICFAYIWPTMMFTRKISQEQRDIPKYQFAIMGAYDSLAGIMQTFGVNFITSSNVIVLVSQSAIPISMIISKITLQAQYTFSQYLGAGVVLFGILVVLTPTFVGQSPANAVPTPGGETMQLVWIFVLVISCIPMCLSSVYKEKALGEMEIDVVYLNGWVAVFQFLIAIPLCVPSAWVIDMPLSEIMPNMYNGMLCYAGINSITEASPGINPDDCALAPWFVTAYMLVNIIYNVLGVVVLKHGSANIVWMASTIIVPLSNVAFSLKFMPGHQPITFYDFVGLFFIMLGLVLYRFMQQIVEVYNRCLGKEDTEEMKRAKKAAREAERKQPKFVGLNQVEALNTFIDTRVVKEQKKSLYRSTEQIRGTLLGRLGIPPSPQISRSPYTRAAPISATYVKDGQIPKRTPLMGGGPGRREGPSGGMEMGKNKINGATRPAEV